MSTSKTIQDDKHLFIMLAELVVRGEDHKDILCSCHDLNVKGVKELGGNRRKLS